MMYIERSVDECFCSGIFKVLVFYYLHCTTSWNNDVLFFNDFEPMNQYLKYLKPIKYEVDMFGSSYEMKRYQYF